ncbi:nucleotidyltransferase domain-containing protein [Tenacibaculum haliotis]|uniref:nucleotidyltransferase domain-containing protein n=1 Tax=Tenacibaculum haliotis TaxID=1888914 RepID=UPI0021B05EBF|nr:nucleotidyltransferase family protein [Tenacibaculum haliotis]MCT4697629.1 nucleotidyltransferase family protein [Tenacibaculum haliotis]
MMNYKDTLFFVGKCLTITHEKHNRKLIEEQLKLNNVNWENVVKLSTAHYVFPALYCNLKRVNLLHYLPEDLVTYMKHITDLNRERNEQIIKEAKEINELLLSNKITPIFLKGTGNLLDGLYDDVAERMVGDIDFLVEKTKFYSCINVLKKNGYLKKNIDNTILNRHYPRLTKQNKIAAIEVHYKMVTKEMFFNYNYVKNTLKKSKNNVFILSNINQILLTCLNKQINDKGQWTKSITFRNSYDLYLLSKHINTKIATTNLNYSKSNYLFNFIASTSYFFNTKDSLFFKKTKQTDLYINKQLTLIKTPKLYTFYIKSWELFFLYYHRFSVILKSLYKKEYRNILFKKLNF